MAVRASLCSNCHTALARLKAGNLEEEDGMLKYDYQLNLSAFHRSCLKGCPSCRWLQLERCSNLRKKNGHAPRDEGDTTYNFRWSMIDRDFVPFSTAKSGYPGSREVSFAVGAVRDDGDYRFWRKGSVIHMHLEQLAGSVCLPLTKYYCTTSTGSDETLAIAKNWIDTCISSHRRCSPKRPSNWRPSRLVRVMSTPDGKINASLHESYSNEFSYDVTYMALSHRWLDPEPFQLRSDNIHLLRTSIPSQRLKTSVRDAMAIAVRFNIPYLWVDSLCIIQNDANDRNCEFPRMHQIYSYAYCTIAAQGGEGPESGCFSARDPSVVSTFAVELRLQYVTKNYVLRLKWDTQELAEGPLSKRAWIFQERFLSPRIIDFSRRQIYGKCREVEASESYPNGKPARLGSIRISAESVLKLAETPTYGNNEALTAVWRNIVNHYTRLTLTFDEDRLNAISGVAAFCKKIFGDEYISGLWRSTLPAALLWVPTEYNLTIVSDRRRLHTTAPSWSWASVTGAVDLSDALRPGDEIHVQIIRPLRLDVPGASVNDHSTLPVVDNIDLDMIHLTGSPWKARCSRSSGGKRYKLVPDGEQSPLSSDWDLAMTCDILHEPPLQVTCLPIYTRILRGEIKSSVTGSHVGLAIVPGSNGTYRRIGTYGCRNPILIDWNLYRQDIWLA